MKCQSCGKKEATVRYYENINGEKQELHLCSDCAQNLGFTSFSNIFSPIFASLQGYNLMEEPEVCKVCGYSFDDYLKTGFFGCPNCYESFSDRLDDLFIKLHGKSRHVKTLNSSKENSKKKITKKDNKDTSSNELEKLKTKLEKLVKDEKYEEAAVIRDKIKEIEGRE